MPLGVTQPMYKRRTPLCAYSLKDTSEKRNNDKSSLPSTNKRISFWMSLGWLSLQASNNRSHLSNDFSVFTEALIASSPSRIPAYLPKSFKWFIRKNNRKMETKTEYKIFTDVNKNSKAPHIYVLNLGMNPVQKF